MREIDRPREKNPTKDGARGENRKRRPSAAQLLAKKLRAEKKKTEDPYVMPMADLALSGG